MGFAQHGRSAAADPRATTTRARRSARPTRTSRSACCCVPQTTSARITGARAGAARASSTRASTYTLKRRGLSQVDLSASGQAGSATFTRAAAGRGRRAAITALGGHGPLPRRARVRARRLQRRSRSINVVGARRLPAGRRARRVARRRGRPRRCKAQAIAARTYAITTAKSDDFDHYADTRSQVYKGVGIEQPSTNAASPTRAGRSSPTRASRSSRTSSRPRAGAPSRSRTRRSATSRKPWLKSVEDPYDDVSPRHRWTLEAEQWRSAAKKLGGLVKGSFKGIRVTKRGESPRIMTAEVVGSRGVDADRRARRCARGSGCSTRGRTFTAIKSRARADAVRRRERVRGRSRSCRRERRSARCAGP